MNSNGWPTVPLGEVANIQTGKLDSNQAVEGGQYPFFTCSPETLRIDKYTFDCEAVLLAGNNANGIFPVKYYSGRFDAYQRTYVITTKDIDRLDIQYLYYHLLRFKDLLGQHSIGTATKFLTLKILEPLAVALPPLPIQRRIAEILGRLDDKIEVNRRINRTLEAMAQALYKHWFVDFGPFQDGEFVESELGPIPAGWEVKTLGEFFPVKTGKKNANAAVEGGQYPFFTCAQDISQIDVFKFDTSAILLAGNGDFNIKFYRGRFDAYQRTYVLAPEKAKLLGLLFFAMKYNLPEITAPHQGTVVRYLTKGMIEDFPIPWSSKLVHEKLVDKFDVLLSNIETRRRENQQLAAIRDYLLPKLLSGEVPVSAAES